MKAYLVFGALTTPRKIEVVKALLEGPQTVTEIQNATGQPQAIISQNLIALKNAGLATVTQEGTRRRYSLIKPDLLNSLLQTANFI